MTNHEPTPHADLLPLKDNISQTWLPHPAFTSCGIGKAGIILTLNADLIRPEDEPALTALETQGVTVRRTHPLPQRPDMDINELRSAWITHPAFMDVGYADDHIALNLNKHLLTEADQPALDELSNWKVVVILSEVPRAVTPHADLLPRKHELTETWYRHPGFSSCGISHDGIVLRINHSLLSDEERTAMEALKAEGIRVEDAPNVVNFPFPNH